MEPKEIKINVPEGYEIDEENSTFKCIKFKPIPKKSKFSDYDGSFVLSGYYLNNNGGMRGVSSCNYESNKDVFATEKQAKMALAISQISQIMANDERFGGVVTDKEWEDVSISKYCICREKTEQRFSIFECSYEFLAFHTREQRDLFLKENEQLVKDYLMID